MYSTYIEVFIFNNFILARALWRAHKFKKILFSLKNITFGGLRRLGCIDIFFKNDPEPGHLFFGSVELTKRTAAALCALPTLKGFRFIVVVYFS